MESRTLTAKGRESSVEGEGSRRELPTKPPNPTEAAAAEEGAEDKSEAARLRKKIKINKMMNDD
jgi:hypothetical protein